LAREATIAIVTAAGAEATVSCKTYLAMLQGLHWVGAALVGEDLARVRAELEQAHQGVEQYLRDWRAHVQWMTGELEGVQRVFITGRGWSMATAGTAGLIVKEATRFAAEGMSAAAFRHGPVETWADGGKVLMWICEGAEVTAALNRKLQGDALRAGARAWFAGADAEYAALRIPTCAAALLPMLEILPIQMLTLALAARLGVEAGHFSVAAKVTSVE
jgi:glucosamine--fructose-6-phosphate aminotransferase (isomerizing)